MGEEPRQRKQFHLFSKGKQKVKTAEQEGRKNSKVLFPKNREMGKRSGKPAGGKLEKKKTPKPRP